MRCAGCVGHVERALRGVPGVIDASVVLALEEATVQVRASGLNADRLVGAVQDAGFLAKLKDGKAACDDRTKGVAGDMPGHADGAARKVVLGVALAAIIMPASMLWHTSTSAWVQLVLAGVAQVVLGAVFVRGASKGLRGKPVRADMDTLIAMGTLAAFAYSVWLMFSANGTVGNATGGHGHLYFESSVMILALVTLGRWIEDRARRRASHAVRALMNLLPPVCLRERDGELVETPVSAVRVGDVLLVRPGASVPTDGVVIDGRPMIDQSMVTGESVPVRREVGQEVIGGTINTPAMPMRMRATRVGSETMLAQIARVVHDAQGEKGGVQRLADRVSGVFVPIVIALSAMTVLAWGLVAGEWGAGVRAGVSVLVVACPCALGLAVPMAVMVGSGVGARMGVLLKNPGVLERVGSIDRVVLDKTGTLTEASLSVTRVVVITDGTREEWSRDASAGTMSGAVKGLIVDAQAVERLSEHPIARAITAMAVSSAHVHAVSEGSNLPGQGAMATVDGRHVRVGRLSEHEHAAVGVSADMTAAGVWYDGILAGAFELDAPVRPGAREAVRQLVRAGVLPVLASGDSAGAVSRAAESLGIADAMSEVSPEGKLSEIRRLQALGHRVAMVGDGVNDAPALAGADVGIAMGGRGTDIAKHAGDIVLMSDDPALIPRAIALSRAMMRRIRVGLGFAMVYNIVLIPLACAGMLSPMLAAGAMALSSLSVVGNALLLARWKN